jgi:hypothetical protein
VLKFSTVQMPGNNVKGSALERKFSKPCVFPILFDILQDELTDLSRHESAFRIFHNGGKCSVIIKKYHNRLLVRMPNHSVE